MNILINIRYFKSPISRLGVQSILEVIFSFKCNYVIFSTQYQEAPSLTALPVPCSFCFSGFSLGSTVQSHTKGIWMWCVPHPSKPKFTLVLLDTEGLGDVEKVGLVLVLCEPFDCCFSPTSVLLARIATKLLIRRISCFPW